MIVSSISVNKSPTFGMNYFSKKYHYGNTEKIKEQLNLDNGKSISIISYKENNNLVHKLVCLKDETGKWIKSKLSSYKGGKLVRTLTSYSEDT